MHPLKETRDKPVCGLSRQHPPHRSSSLCCTHAEAAVQPSHLRWPVRVLSHQSPCFLAFTKFVHSLLIVDSLSLGVKTSGSFSDTSFIERPSTRIPSSYKGNPLPMLGG